MAESFNKIIAGTYVRPSGTDPDVARGYSSKEAFLSGMAATLSSGKPNRAARRALKKVRKRL